MKRSSIQNGVRSSLVIFPPRNLLFVYTPFCINLYFPLKNKYDFYETEITKIYHTFIIKFIDSLFINSLADMNLSQDFLTLFFEKLKRQRSTSPFLTVRTPVSDTKHHNFLLIGNMIGVNWFAFYAYREIWISPIFQPNKLADNLVEKMIKFIFNKHRMILLKQFRKLKNIRYVL